MADVKVQNKSSEQQQPTRSERGLSGYGDYWPTAGEFFSNPFSLMHRLSDEMHRAYRDGGGALGAELSVRIAREALERLPRGGGLVLYTATAIVDGEDLLLRALLPHLRGARFDYRELDPDVFGEELDRSAYRNVERIAVVALDAIKE